MSSHESECEWRRGGGKKRSWGFDRCGGGSPADESWDTHKKSRESESECEWRRGGVKKRSRWGFDRCGGGGSPADDRWDTHKKKKNNGDEEEEAVKPPPPPPRQASTLESESEIETGDEKGWLYAGPSFQCVSPEPSELPIPFLLLAAH